MYKFGIMFVYFLVAAFRISYEEMVRNIHLSESYVHGLTKGEALEMKDCPRQKIILK